MARLKHTLGSVAALVLGCTAERTPLAPAGKDPSIGPEVTLTSICLTSGNTWLNTAFAAQTGTFTAEFDATPGGGGIDGVTGLASGTVAAYTDLAAIVRFNSAGTIDARNGGAYAAVQTIRYTAGTTYHVRLVVNVAGRTYSASVRPAGGGSEVAIGTNYAFRSEQSGAASLGNWGSRTTAGSLVMCDFTLTGGGTGGGTTPAPVATVTVSPASASLEVGKTTQLSATLLDGAGNVLTGRSVTWGSSAPSIATVSSSGLVSAVAAGAATITATSEGQSDSSAVTVTAPPPPPPPSGTCVTSSSSWQSRDFPAQPGRFTIQVDATPNAGGIDGLTGLAGGPANTYADMAGTVRFNRSNHIDMRNGDTYAATNAVPYTAGTTYRVRLVVDVPSHTYSAYVTPAGGTEVAIGANYAFRSEQSGATSLTHLVVRSSGGGTHTVCNWAVSGSTTPSPAPVATVSVTPASAGIEAGATIQLSAALQDTAGNTLTGRTVTWSSSSPAVATVSSSGLVSGIAAGAATITATSEGISGTSTVTVTVPPPPPPTEVGGYFVAPNGSSSGDGSAGRPWSLSYAFGGAGGRLAPGDTVWLRGGRYAGVFRTSLAGAAGRPIVFRQYPGERATIDGGVRTDGPDVVLWGLEIMQSNPLANGSLPTLETHGARTKFINLVIHDAAQQGITYWDGAVDAEVYGCIVYNNGTHQNLDHGTYVHNTTGTKVLADNVFFNNLAYGIHVYATSSNGTQRNVHVIGNVSFNNGTISPNYAAKGNILVGASVPDEGMRVVDNLTYFGGSAGENVRVGYSAANRDAVITGNLIWGGATGLRVADWTGAVVQNNRVVGPGRMVDLTGSRSGHVWSGNRYHRDATATAWAYAGTPYTLTGWQQATGLGAADAAQATMPSPPTVIVRPNKYELGRAHVVVYNWGRQASVTVDLTGVVPVGARYEVRNVQDVFGAPVASGTFGGGSITLPMSGVAPPAPLGRSTPLPTRTGPTFDTFLVTIR